MCVWEGRGGEVREAAPRKSSRRLGFAPPWVASQIYTAAEQPEPSEAVRLCFSRGADQSHSSTSAPTASGSNTDVSSRSFTAKTSRGTNQ